MEITGLKSHVFVQFLPGDEIGAVCSEVYGAILDNKADSISFAFNGILITMEKPKEPWRSVGVPWENQYK